MLLWRPGNNHFKGLNKKKCRLFDLSTDHYEYDHLLFKNSKRLCDGN